MPGTTMMRVFHCLPSERMIQIRPTWQSTRDARASASRAAAMNGRPSSHTSASAPTSSPVCSATIAGKWPRPLSTPPRANAQRACRTRRDELDDALAAGQQDEHGEQHDAEIVAPRSGRPAQQHVLARDPRPEREQHAVGPGGLVDHVGEHVQHRRRRQVADRVERPPAGLEVGTARGAVRARTPRARAGRPDARPRPRRRRTPRSCSASSSSTSWPMLASIVSETAAVSTMRNPVPPMSQPMTLSLSG